MEMAQLHSKTETFPAYEVAPFVCSASVHLPHEHMLGSVLEFHAFSTVYVGWCSLRLEELIL